MPDTTPAPDDQVSLDVAAPPDAVWRMVSDIRNMGRWSPETFRTHWLGGARAPAVGARFIGWNRWRFVYWATRSVVEVSDPGREFTFCTVVWGRKRTRWSYRFEPAAGGTRITEERSVLSNTWLRVGFQRLFMPGHKESFATGMRTTLERIRAAAEQSVGVQGLPSAAG